MKCTVYRKRSDVSTLDVEHKSLYTCRNRKANISEKENGSKFLATRRNSLEPMTIYFDPNGGTAEYTERSYNVARRIKDFPESTYGDKHLFGWYDLNGNLVTNQDVASVRTQYLTAHWVDPTAVALDPNGGTCDVQHVNLYRNVSAYNLRGVKAVGTDSTPNFIGWFTSATGGTQVKDVTVYNGSYTKLYAHYVSDVWTTAFTVRVDSDHNKAGIYTANRKSTSKHLYVDWGDGFTDDYNGNISQQVHTYSVPGIYQVKLSDNVGTFAITANSAVWYQVTSQNYYTVVSIDYIADSITSIPTYAFCYLNALESACWCNNVKSIPNYAFYYCGPNFQSIAINEGITSIGQYAFSNCSGLNDITLPSTLTTLNTYSFQYCFSKSKGTQLKIPNGVTTIPNYCFAYCQYLDDVVLPDSLTTIGQNAFRQCWYYAKGEKLVLPQSLTTIDNYAFYQCRYLDTQLPDNIVRIGQYAFYQCQYELKSLVIPQSCTSLENYSLAYCYNLTDITVRKSTPPTTGAQTFGNNTTTYTGRVNYNKKTNMLHVPANATGYNANPWGNPLCYASYCGFTLVYDANLFSASPMIWIEFNPNGGSGGGMQQFHVNCELGKIGISVIAPEGKEFDGWWTMRDGGMKITESSICDGEWQVAYAHWKDI